MFWKDLQGTGFPKYLSVHKELIPLTKNHTNPLIPYNSIILQITLELPLSTVFFFMNYYLILGSYIVEVYPMQLPYSTI